MNTTCCVCKRVDFQQTSTQYSISYFDCAENFCDSCGFNEKKVFCQKWCVLWRCVCGDKIKLLRTREEMRLRFLIRTRDMLHKITSGLLSVCFFFFFLSPLLQSPTPKMLFCKVLLLLNQWGIKQKYNCLPLDPTSLLHMKLRGVCLTFCTGTCGSGVPCSNRSDKQLPAIGHLACSGEQSLHSMVPLKMFESLLPRFSSLIANDVFLLQNLIAVSGYDKVGLNLRAF